MVTSIAVNVENNGKGECLHVIRTKVYEGAVHPCRSNRQDNQRGHQEHLWCKDT